jgi:hypothetical protein
MRRQACTKKMPMPLSERELIPDVSAAPEGSQKFSRMLSAAPVDVMVAAGSRKQSYNRTDPDKEH